MKFYVLLKLQYNTYTVIEAYFLNCRCNLNCFVSSVIRSTNVSLNTSVQDEFPWKLLSAVRWDSSHRFHLTFYHKKINHHNLKASWTFRKSHAEGLLIFCQFPLKVFIKLNLLLQREEPLISRFHGHIQRFLKKFTNNQKSGNVKKGVLYRLIVRFLYSIILIR